MSLRKNTLLMVATAGLVAASVVAQEPSSAPAAKLRPGAAPRAATPLTPEFGGSTVSYYRVGAAEFKGGNNFTPYDYTGLNPFRVWADFLLFATPHLPGGALLKSLELDDCDTNVSGNHLFLYLLDCDYLGACSNTLATLSSADNYFNLQCSFVSVDLSPLNYTVNNQTHELLLYAFFQSTDITNQLAGATIGYQLQVSPDPATATFSDVPVGHPFHRFVEALVAAGITGGYPDGRYGVDDAITRGQMAVFLSVALGLNWSQ